MRKHYPARTLSKIACLVFTAFAALCPHVMAAEESLVLSNCAGNPVTYLPVSSDDAGAALYYPSSVMSAYKGCEIKELQVALYMPSKGDDGTLRIFITHDLNGKPDYEQTLTSWKRSWNTVELDTPYPVDGGDLYIGYEAKGQKYLSYCNSFVTNEEWIKRDDKGWVKYDGIYSAAIQAVVTGDDIPNGNVRLGTVNMPGYALVGENVVYRGEFYNLGVSDVNSLTFTYMVDGKEFGTENVSGLSVKPRGTGAFTLQGPVFREEGEFDVQLLISAVNGEDDVVENDNASAVKRTLCRDSYTKRKVLLEIFSTEKCTACPGAHKSISAALEGRDDFVEIGHHAGFYTDKFTVDESTEYEWFYTETRGTYAPAMMLDRTNFGESYPDIYKDDVPMISADGGYAKMFIDEAVAIPAFATVDIDADMNLTSRKLDLHIEGTQLLPVSGDGNVMLYVWLTEDNIFTETQSGSVGDFTQRHVARRSLTPTWGTPVDLTAGYSENFSTDIPADWDIDNMRVVAFVAMYNPDDKNGCRVLNSESVSLKDFSSGIELVENGRKEDGRADVYTVSGVRVLKNVPTSDIKRLGKGVYIVNGKKLLK